MIIDKHKNITKFFNLEFIQAYPWCLFLQPALFLVAPIPLGYIQVTPAITINAPSSWSLLYLLFSNFQERTKESGTTACWRMGTKSSLPTYGSVEKYDLE